MKFSQYKENFILEAKKNELSDEFIFSSLLYAEKLFNQNLPVIFDTKHLSLLIGVEISKLYTISNDSKKYYRHFKISKSSGGFRTISEPYPTLKIVQKWIQDNILVHSINNIYSKAFKKGVSIKDNAKFHKDQKVLINFDIENYFGSISEFDIENYFSSLGYYKDISKMLSKLCSYKGVLPQGSITSPSLSNVLTIRLDQHMIDYARMHKLRYTRYADDLSFSGESLPKNIYNFVLKVLNESGFKLNHKKSKIRRDYQRQVVTGIVVNKKMQKDKIYRDKIRQEVYYIKKHGLKSHLEYYECDGDSKSYLKSLLGRISHVLFINPYDKKMKEYKEAILDVFNRSN